jgi:hypothetical protein
MVRVSAVIHGWLGWCPDKMRVHTPVLNQPDFTERNPSHGPGVPGSGQVSLPVISIPRWMTEASLLILFATLFVGGTYLWPVFVLAVIIAFTIILCRHTTVKGVTEP